MDVSGSGGVGRWVSGRVGGWMDCQLREGTGLEDRGDEFPFGSVEFGVPLDKWMGTMSKRWENIWT